VELVNFGGSTEALLEAIATRKADAGVGMALRWLKPLEMGFDVKITGGTHGGCMRLAGPASAGLTDDINRSAARPSPSATWLAPTRTSSPCC
jgi:NitT/TauT family transport system substrate-binding protein